MRTSAIILTLVLAGPLASAQQGFHFGPVGELSRSRQTFSPRVAGFNEMNRNSWGAGLVLQWGLSPSVSLALEPGLLNRGGVLDVPAESGTVTTRLRYFELPARLRVAFTHGAVRPYAVLGPGVGYLHRASDLGRALGQEELKDVKKQARTLALSASLGLGLAVGEAGRHMFLEALYTRGFTNVTRSDGVTIRNQGLQFRMGFLFGGGR